MALVLVHLEDVEEWEERQQKCECTVLHVRGTWTVVPSMCTRFRDSGI